MLKKKSSHKETCETKNISVCGRILLMIVWLKVSRPLAMKKEGIQTRNRKSSSKSGVSKSAGDDSSSVWSTLEPMLVASSSSRSQPPHHFRAFPAPPSHRPPLASYYTEAPPYRVDADAVYQVAYAHAQQVPGDYASIAAFGGDSSFTMGTAAGYCP